MSDSIVGSRARFKRGLEALAEGCYSRTRLGVAWAYSPHTNNKLMGDRGNIVIRDGGKAKPDGWLENDVFLYTHWGGSELEKIAKKALAKNWRWDDAPYLARIVFEVMLKGNEDRETGFGIATHLTDNEHWILVLDVSKQQVYWCSEKGVTHAGASFSEFVKNGFPEPKDSID